VEGGGGRRWLPADDVLFVLYVVFVVFVVFVV